MNAYCVTGGVDIENAEHGFHGNWPDSSRKMEGECITDFVRPALGAGLYCAVDEASVVVAELLSLAGGVIGGLLVASMRAPFG
jgi:hypothetical protein